MNHNRKHHDNKPRPQRISVVVDTIPEPLTEPLAEAITTKILYLIVNELIELGADITKIRVEVQGPLSPW
jgi:hypothetical protein